MYEDPFFWSADYDEFGVCKETDLGVSIADVNWSDALDQRRADDIAEESIVSFVPAVRLHACGWCFGSSVSERLRCSEWAPQSLYEDPFFWSADDYCDYFGDEGFWQPWAKDVGESEAERETVMTVAWQPRC